MKLKITFNADGWFTEYFTLEINPDDLRDKEEHVNLSSKVADRLSNFLEEVGDNLDGRRESGT
jgi:hypothetical protein